MTYGRPCVTIVVRVCIVAYLDTRINSHTQFNGLLQYQSVRAQRGHGGWAHDLSFSASRVHALVGAKTVYAIARSPWAVGGELYYTHTETSGGCKLLSRRSLFHREHARFNPPSQCLLDVATELALNGQRIAQLTSVLSSIPSWGT